MSFQLTYEMLHKIAPGANVAILQGLVEPLNKYLPLYEINTLLRVEHFLGQAAEETASFRTLVEYASGREYEGRRDLGNYTMGDGVHYKGRGIFQLTGKANYSRYGQKLGLDLVSHPELAATAEVAVRTACEYWKDHGLNALADNDDVVGITKRINGGTNGLEMREQFVDKADDVLSPLFPGE